MPFSPITFAVCSWPALVMPQSVDPVEPRLSPTPSTSRLTNQHRKAQPVDLVQRRRANQQCAAHGAARHAPHHRDLGAHVVGDAARPRPAQQRGNVLDADGQAGQHRAVAHAQMHKRRQHRQRQAYGNIADKREVNVSGNARRSAPRGRPERNRNIGSRGVRHRVDRKPKTLNWIRSF